jgi:hypothetical protein
MVVPVDVAETTGAGRREIGAAGAGKASPSALESGDK